MQGCKALYIEGALSVWSISSKAEGLSRFRAFSGYFQESDLPDTVQYLRAERRCVTAMPPEGCTRTGILPAGPSIDRGSREAEVGFEPRTFRSVNSRSNHLGQLPSPDRLATNGLVTIEQGSKTLICISFTKLNIHLLLERVFLNFSGYSLTVSQIQANATKRLHKFRNRYHFSRDAKRIYGKTYYSHASSVRLVPEKKTHRGEHNSYIPSKRVRQRECVRVGKYNGLKLTL
ncbi:hypothetical protein CSKR_104354 [Clonorchis sinensis]|uniref:Uncharacterized protein n=1 Tax=Clonorchis sinensis TaxID=79923 RepID=A0A419QDE5_CLOSI|nr:hypothetical protein CSKR_104354 [Clonorchis sinensis]